MTFQEFKSHFETFSKIDTAEQLAFCQQQYQQHLLYIEDANYFEPAENNPGSDFTGQYVLNLNRILGFDSLREGQIFFLVQPSFEPEQLLILEPVDAKYLVTCITLVKNYWSVYYANNNIVDIDKTVVSAELSRAMGDKIFKLLDQAISTARKPEAGGFTLDGVVYKLSKRYGGEQITVFKHSPDENSRSGKLIQLMQLLICACKKTGYFSVF